ncbi:MAG: ComEC family competence protein, partial [Lachnospiraceae bacterium]|nr:ComEC family competence protein [Lachnospiraceae bacterium]
MRRPLCCVCVAFVATVFLYLQCNPLPGVVQDCTEGERITLFGEVCKKEYQSGHQGKTLVIRLENVQRWSPGMEQDGQQAVRGDVICYVGVDADLVEPKAGSTIAVEGEVSYFGEARNPGAFDARAYYRILGVDFRLYKAEIRTQSSRYSVYHESLYQLRRHFEGIFDRVLAPKDASIMKAVLLGSKSELDAQSRQLFQKSGIAHILAISGLHITMLGMGLYKLLGRSGIPQAVCAVVSVGLMIAYGDMVGMSSSAYRAVFMFGMQLAARMLRRTYDMLTALALAAMLILLEQPLYLYHAGFLLSFGAILGAGCLSDVVKPQACGRGKHLTQRAALSLCGSLSIFLVHFPIMLCVYYEFPVYSFLLNLVVIPAMSFLMAAGLLCLGAGSLPAALGFGVAKGMGFVCHALLSAFEWLCAMSLKLPFANWIVGRPKDWRIYAYGAVILFLYAAHHYGKHLSKGAACGRRGIDVGLPLPLRFMTVLAAVLLISSSSADGVAMTFL